jgi:hypothetical protein
VYTINISKSRKKRKKGTCHPLPFISTHQRKKRKRYDVTARVRDSIKTVFDEDEERCTSIPRGEIA